jgi:hypothetical protein
MKPTSEIFMVDDNQAGTAARFQLPPRNKANFSGDSGNNGVNAFCVRRPQAKDAKAPLCSKEKR